MPRFFFCLVLAAALGRGQGVPESPAPLTLEKAIDEAVEKNLALMAERYNVSVAEARILQARLRPNPVFTYGQD